MGGQLPKCVNLRLDKDWPDVFQFNFTKASLTQTPWVLESVRLGSSDWDRGGSFRNGGPCLGMRPSQLGFALPKVHVMRAVIFKSRQAETENSLPISPPLPRLVAQTLFSWVEQFPKVSLNES